MRRGFFIISYHKIDSPPQCAKDPFLYDSPQQFDFQLASLKQHCFRCLDLSAALMHSSQSGVVVTFDDGCASAFEEGLPILQKHGFKAIQFLVSERLGGRNEWDIRKGDAEVRLMDQSQVREWLAAGNQIGSHSKSHRNLKHLRTEQAREEIFGSKKSLEDDFGLQIHHFSYPYGSWNAEVRDLVAEAGYETACTMDFGICDPRGSRFELRRILPLSTTALMRKCFHRFRRRLL